MSAAFRTTAELHARYLRTTGACTDTRKLLPGGMFFALKGPNFNANAFAPQALAGGCSCAVVDDPAVKSAIQHVNRRAGQDCGWFKRQGL